MSVCLYFLFFKFLFDESVCFVGFFFFLFFSFPIILELSSFWIPGNSDVEIELIDNDDTNSAVISLTSPVSGSPLLCTYRCPDSTNRLEMRVCDLIISFNCLDKLLSLFSFLSVVQTRSSLSLPFLFVVEYVN